MRILGIDPGLVGGLAIYVTGDDLNGPLRCVCAVDMPVIESKMKGKRKNSSKRVDVAELQRFIKANFPDHAIIERAQAMPDQNAASGFRYGRAVGAIEATVLCSGVALSIVSPRQWKGHFELSRLEDEKTAAYKERSRLIALKVRGAKEFLKRKKDHGRAEALLMAIYGAHLIDISAIVVDRDEPPRRPPPMWDDRQLDAFALETSK